MGEVKKADMFYSRRLRQRLSKRLLLNVSVNEFGYVNPAYMLSIEPDITNAKYPKSRTI